MFFIIGKINDNGEYEDNLAQIIAARLKAPNEFWFDSVTSIPWTYLDWFAMKVCISIVHFGNQFQSIRNMVNSNFTNELCVQACQAGSDVAVSGGNGRALRAIKILRMLRIIRLLKLVKIVT